MSVLRKFVPASLLFSAALAAHAAEPVVGLLLRWQISTKDEQTGAGGSSEYLIYRDGLVLHRSLPSEDFNFVIYRRGNARADALRRLKASLTENHVGIIQAPPGCAAVNPFPTSVDYTAVLTWFGMHNRQNRITINDIGSEFCPGEVNQLVLRIESDFLGNVVYSDTVTTQP